MTLIIGIEDPANSRAVVATDSGAWRGDQADVLRTSKTWRSNGWIAGVSGHWTASLRLRQVPFPEMTGATREETEEALVAWSYAAGKSLTELDRDTGRTGPECTYDAAVLVAHGGHVWYVCSGCVTGTARGCQAIGCEAYAIGALSALELVGKERSSLEKARLTMLAVQGVTKSIIPPYRWMDTLGAEGVWE